MTEAPAPASVRVALPRLANGLIAYGVLGLVLALIAALALAWAGGRFASLGERIETQALTIADTLDRTATALQDASASATSFAVTLERTPPIVRQVADALGEMETGLQSISSQLAAIEILGRQPLAGTAERVNSMASALDGLDARLGLVASDLEGNRDALLANSASLAALSEQLTSVADQLRSEGVSSALADIRAVLIVLGLVLLTWIVLPSAGALGLGWWLRRQVAPGGVVE
ncbi:MAG TPA: hypothetical protein VFM38_12310 [Candidatus Limnocylindrales bacterium]|nr:hypothetical protein [Candidatus Limnocylindrales bacterium]